MAREFKLPDLGEGIFEGEIADILVSVGDEVKEDQPILEVETDKATVEITSPFSGKVSEIRVKKGDLAEVGDVLLVFDGEAAAEEEEKQPLQKEVEEKSVEKEPEKETEEEEKEERVEKPAPSGGPVLAAPSTRRLARELNVDIQQVSGSGPGGRITPQDVKAFAEGGATKPEAKPAGREEKPAEKLARMAEGVPSFSPSAIPIPELPDFSRWGEVERVPLRSIRRATARHMALAWSQIPHINHKDVADITRLEAIRGKLKEQIAEKGGSLTLTVFALKAVVAALKQYPSFNASLDIEKEEIILKKYYNIGVAVATDRGLLVPVIREVDQKTLTQLSIELRELVEKTRDGKADLEDLQGATFSITNPGPLGGVDFSPIISYPEVSILGMAKAKWTPVVAGEGPTAEIVPRYMLPLVLAADHRIVDGADIARFMTTIVKLLEDPDKLLLEV
jgi:pyruvate dehydrogenase E2 component (dihydrolipoamide acetyltransferase)